MIRERVLAGFGARQAQRHAKSGPAIGLVPVADAMKEAIQALLQAPERERTIVAQLGVSKGALSPAPGL